MNKPKIGDRYVVVHARGRGRDRGTPQVINVTVSRVGRQYAYLITDSTTPDGQPFSYGRFDWATGFMDGNYGNSGRVFESREAYEASERREAAYRELQRRFDAAYQMPAACKLDAGQLEHIEWQIFGTRKP